MISFTPDDRVVMKMMASRGEQQLNVNPSPWWEPSISPKLWLVRDEWTDRVTRRKVYIGFNSSQSPTLWHLSPMLWLHTTRFLCTTAYWGPFFISNTCWDFNFVSVEYSLAYVFTWR